MKRKILAILLVISCLFAFNNSVNAVLSTNTVGEAGSKLITKKLSKPVNGYDTFETGIYSIATFDNVKSYCIDPGGKAVRDGVDCPATVMGDSDFSRI